MDKLGPKWTYGPNRKKIGPNRINVDQMEPKWTGWTEYDQCGPNRTKVDRI